jgi:DNA polymerase-4
MVPWVQKLPPVCCGIVTYGCMSTPHLPTQPDAPPDAAIAHMDMDTFFVSVERLKDPSLAGKPVIVGGSRERGVVASCSYETRAFGVHSGMGIKQALRLCPQAIVLKGSYDDYVHYSDQVRAIVQDNTPACEFASIDEFYCDLTGMDRFFGSFRFACDLRDKIMATTRLPVSLGHATTKTTAKIATGTAKPNGTRNVPRGTERDFLAPMSVRKIPGIGGKTAEVLAAHGIRLIRDLQNRTPQALEKLLGQYGPVLWNKANGLHIGVVDPNSERKSIGSEETFEKDTTDRDALKALLLTMTERNGYRLRAEGKLAGCVTVKIRFSDFTTTSRQQRIPYTDDDAVAFDTAKHLFDELYKGQAALRLVGVAVSHLVDNLPQLELFDDSVEKRNLNRAVDGIKGKYGRSAVFRAKGMEAYERREPLLGPDGERLDVYG